MTRSPSQYRVGSIDLTILSDGVFYIDAGAAFGVVPRVVWQPFVRTMDDQYRIPLGLNCLLLRSQGRTILIETGVGDKDGARAVSSPAAEGNLLAELAARSLRPDDLDVVINTHLHADHCGWNTRRLPDEGLAPTFPRARYLIQRSEWEDATHPNERTRSTYLAENILPVAEAGALDLVDGELALTSEVTVIPTPGHTGGHASVVIVSGGETAIYIGDMVQHEVQLERLAWVSAFDVLPLMSIESKKRIIERAIRERALVIAVHCPYPGVGRLTMTEDGKRRWEPAA